MPVKFEESSKNDANVQVLNFQIPRIQIFRFLCIFLDFLDAVDEYQFERKDISPVRLYYLFGNFSYKLYFDKLSR